MAITIEVVGMKAFKGSVNGEAIDSGTLYGRVKLDQRYNKPGENFKGGHAVEEWKVPTPRLCSACSTSHFRSWHLSKSSAFPTARKPRKW